MIKKFILFAFLLFPGTLFMDVSGQNMVIVYRDGAETLKPLEGIRKCTFSDNNLMLNFPDGKTESYALDVIRKIMFSAGTTATIQRFQANTTDIVSVFPNPVYDRLYYKNVPEGCIIKIFRIDGTAVISTVVSGNEGYLTTGGLPSGIYIVKINNQVFKMIKP